MHFARFGSSDRGWDGHARASSSATHHRSRSAEEQAWVERPASHDGISASRDPSYHRLCHSRARSPTPTPSAIYFSCASSALTSVAFCLLLPLSSPFPLRSVAEQPSARRPRWRPSIARSVPLSLASLSALGASSLGACTSSRAQDLDSLGSGQSVRNHNNTDVRRAVASYYAYCAHSGARRFAYFRSYNNDSKFVKSLVCASPLCAR